jgi:methylglutaconyl-CoA hydratase
MAVVETDLAGGVLTITLADEERRNALGAQLVNELVAAFQDADRDPGVRVVVLTNRGTVFCAGANLSDRAGAVGTAAIASPVDLFGHIRRSPKPYVGRLAGHCVAGGMGLAAALDISVAVEDAKFGFTEVRLGLAPAMIAVVCLPKMRPAEARAAFLRGGRFSGAEAARLGLINAAVPADRLDAEVGAVVDDLLLGGPEAIAACKQLLAQVPGMAVDDAFGWTSELSARLFTGAEGREGMAAYLEKRPPSWATESASGGAPGG